MSYKLTKEECEAILRDEYIEVLNKQLTHLQERLELTDRHKDSLRLQGRIYELRLIMGLNEKAFNQLN